MRDTELEVMQQYHKYSRGQVNSEPIEVVSPKDPIPEDGYWVEHYTSLDNIDDIDRLIELIRQLLQRAWGKDCPVLVDQYPTNTAGVDIKMPMIVYDYYDREIAENTKKYPQLMGSLNYKGETYEVYSQWFDCVLEFFIIDVTARGAKVLAKRFEIFMQTYMQYFKYIGVSNIYFLNEPKSSPVQLANQDYQRRALKYKVKLERRFLKRYSEIIGTVQVVLGVDGDISGSSELPGVYADLSEDQSM